MNIIGTRDNIHDFQCFMNILSLLDWKSICHHLNFSHIRLSKTK